MNRNGQIGQVLTSFPSLLFVFIIMLFSVILHGYLSKDLSVPEYKSPVAPYERENIAEFFPEKNIAKETIAVEFLNSEIKVGNEIVKVEYAIEQMCRTGGGPYFRTDVAPIFEKKFSSLTPNGKFAIARKIGFDRNARYQIYSSNTFLNVDDLVVSSDEFNKIFGNSLVQQKTLCAEGGKPTTLFVLPGDNQLT